MLVLPVFELNVPAVRLEPVPEADQETVYGTSACAVTVSPLLAATNPELKSVAVGDGKLTVLVLRERATSSSTFNVTVTAC